MRKLFFILFVAAASAATYALHRPQAKVKSLTDAELMHCIDSCIKNDIPLSAEPFFTEAKQRASLVKDTRAMLDLIDKEIGLNCRRLETVEEINKAIDKEIEGAWTPLREMLWIRKAVLNFNKPTIDDVKENICSKADELRSISAYSITDSNDVIIPMSAYDYIMLTINNSNIIKEEQRKELYKSWHTNGDATSRILYEASTLNNGISRDHGREKVAIIDSLAFSPETHAMADLAWGMYYQWKAFDTKREALKSNAYADTAITRYKAINTSFKVLSDIAKLRIENIDSKGLQIETENPIMPEKYIPLQIRTKNIGEVCVRIFNNTANFDVNKNEPIKTYNITIPSHTGKIATQTTYTELDGLPVGEYIIAVSADDLIDIQSVHSTNIMPAHISSIESDYLAILNATNGSALTTAQVNNKPLDDYAMFDITSRTKSGTNHKLNIQNGNDKVKFETYTSKSYKPRNNTSSRMNILTDRSIYRPGQTIYFKIWNYKADTERMWADSTRKAVDVTLKSHNGTKIASANVSVNRFGTASGELNIPDDVDLGMATIIADNYKGSTNVRIEEYKRSGNKLSFDPIREAYLVGDSITIKGKATSADGKPIANANIIVNDTSTITTDEKGLFKYAYLDKSKNLFDSHTNIHFKMTDLGGETTEADQSVHLNTKGNVLDISAKGYIKKTEKANIDITSSNTNGQPYKANVTYVIERLKHRDEYLPSTNFFPDTIVGKYSLDIHHHNYSYIVVDTIMQQTVIVDSLLSLPIDVDKLTTGLYRIKAKTQSHNGKRNGTKDFDVRSEAEFTIIDVNGKNDINDALFLTYYENFTPGKPATFYVGTRIKDANILVVAEFAGEIFNRQYVHCSEGIMPITIDVPKSKQNYTQLHVFAILVNNNRYYTQNITMPIANVVDTDLKLQLETWHDKSAPAAEETATLIIKADSTTPTEIVASMYDARLDRICNNTWNNRRFYKNTLSSYSYASRMYIPSPSIQFKNGYYQENNGHIYDDSNNRYNELVSNLAKSKLKDIYNEFEILYPWNSLDEMVVVGYGVKRSRSNGLKQKAMATMEAAAVEDHRIVVRGTSPMVMSENVSYDSAMPEPSPEAEEEAAETEDDEELDDSQLRTDFRETVFFYPNLTTDTNGRATFTFRIPDNITTYNFRAIAHNKDMHSGYVTSTMAVTKPLTVKAWVPRVLTEGDTINVGMAISSKTPEDSITTRLTCKTISLAGNITAKIIDIDKTHWSIVVPNDIDTLQIAFSATGGNFTDGERHSIPVRRRYQEITESQSFMLMTAGTFAIDNPFASDPVYANRNTTFSYTANTWPEVLRALPHLYNCIYPSSDNYLGQIESSAIAMMLMKRDDVKYWVKTMSTTKDNVESHHLDEKSPWKSYNSFLEKHDAEVVKMLSGNNSRKTYEKALRNLRKMQLSDGSFPWFKGMDGSDFITRHILSTLGLLVRYGMVPSSDVSDICRKGQTYLESNIAKEVKRWEKEKVKELTTDYTMLHELYTISCLSSINLKDENISKAIKAIPSASVLRDPAKKLMASLIYNRIGRKSEAQLLLKSITENLVRPDDYTAHISLVGHFWYTNHMFVHSMLVMSINELDPDNGDKYRIINWLLKEKRTTHWNDTQATSRAVLSLLTQTTDNRQTDTLKVNYTTSELTGETKETTKQKVTIPMSITSQDISSVVIDHTGKMPSWGSWKRNALMPTDDMKAHSSDDISVTRNITAITSNGKAIDKKHFDIGDRVRITLTVKTSVDMDFVRVSDFRPAAFEPIDQVSGYRGWWWLRNTLIPDCCCHYFSPNDVSVDFFIERLPRGIHTFSYECYVTNSGQMNAGYAEAVCLYTDGFEAHTEGSRITTK
ncbi:MAG: MG2 domain-containing protein [Bacteroidales bacterium]|nr:MG2 domain-containing protein [Bacteroidales bacterium]